MLSKSAKYALSAVIYIAEKSEGGNKLQSKDIALGIEAPKPYVSKLLQLLTRRALISSIKGPAGGFYLDESNWENKLIDIIYAVDGESRIHSCALDIERCNAENPCVLHHVIYPAKAALVDYLKANTIRDLTNEQRNHNTFIS